MADYSIRGAKLALFLGENLVILRRDDRDDIPWPNCLDLPGGGREAGESAEECVLRETEEEVGIRLRPDQLIYRVDYARPDGLKVAFFAAELPPEAVNRIVFGNEGQGWMLMYPDDFMSHIDVVPHFPGQVRAYLAYRAGSNGEWDKLPA